VAGAVLNIHAKLLANALPVKSVAPVVIFAENKVFAASSADGENVATLPVQLTVPATEVVPGPVTVNVVADLSVAQFTGALKVALRTWLTATPVAPLLGVVDTTRREVPPEPALPGTLTVS
jgi:hypothetical protein